MWVLRISALCWVMKILCPHTDQQGLWETTMSTQRRLPVIPLMDTHTAILTQIPWFPWGRGFYNHTCEKRTRTTNGRLPLWDGNSDISFTYLNSFECSNGGADSTFGPYTHHTHTHIHICTLANRDSISSYGKQKTGRDPVREREREGRRGFKDQKTDVNRLADSPPND